MPYVEAEVSVLCKCDHINILFLTQATLQKRRHPFLLSLVIELRCSYSDSLCPAERGRTVYAHPLDGDGYVLAFAFAPGGRVHFSSRYVMTRQVPQSLSPRRL